MSLAHRTLAVSLCLGAAFGASAQSVNPRLLAHDRAFAIEPIKGDPSPEASSLPTRWYGWQIMLVDLSPLAVLAVPLATNSV